jgi:hypothetical protein
MAALKREGLITEEQYQRTTEIVITAKAGEAVRMDHRTLLREHELALIAQTITVVDSAEEAGIP